MSSNSFAAFRKSLGPELNALAEEHMQHESVSTVLSLTLRAN
jgi:hypothetical protein